MALLPSALQSADGGLGAAAEFLGFHAHAPGKGDEKVAEGCIVVRIMGHVGTVFVAAAGNTPLCNLFVPLAQRMGVETEKFGSSTKSTIRGLES